MRHDDSNGDDSDNDNGNGNGNGNGRVKFKLEDVKTLASIQEAFRYLKQDLQNQKRQNEKLQTEIDESHKIFNDLRYEVRLELDELKEELSGDIKAQCEASKGDVDKMYKEHVKPIEDGHMPRWMGYLLAGLVGIISVETTFIFNHILGG